MRPNLILVNRVRAPRSVILVAHGGKARSQTPDSNLGAAALRMLAMSADLALTGQRRGAIVAQLRYRTRGYNDGEAVDDLVWALDRLREDHGVPTCVVGHSMGARAALRAAGHRSVAAVAALAPWLPDDEPVGQLADRDVLIVHGLSDRVTSPLRSARYAERAEPVARSLRFTELGSTGHAMLRRAATWHRLVREFCFQPRAVGPVREATP
jgi:pimeloyl-ACP methyl ester carboxylesterase